MLAHAVPRPDEFLVLAYMRIDVGRMLKYQLQYTQTSDDSPSDFADLRCQVDACLISKIVNRFSLIKKNYPVLPPYRWQFSKFVLGPILSRTA